MNPPPPPPSDLPSAISALNSLLQLSISAVQSLPIPITTTTTTTLLPCPFNSNHQVPPSSLFSHYLNCPFSLLSPPHYSHTLNSTATPSSTSTSSALSFSLEHYIDENTPTNNFFYQNCPAPVTKPAPPPPILTIPRVLYLEFDEDREHVGSPVISVKFLPSEIWAIRSEIDKWDGSVCTFSIRVLRAILRLRDCKLSRLREWVVESSPKYGVIVDFAMRDHVVLLVKFCLKAIVREAFGLVGFLFSGEELNVEGMVWSSEESGARCFHCPVFGEVFTWLVSRFGLLYGEVNARFFAVGILRECILESAVDASLFPLKEVSTDLESGYCGLKEPANRSLSVDDCKQNEGESVGGETVGGSAISLSQVAAAVAALHERSLIEEKVRATRNSRHLSAYQRNVEHACISKMADEERTKRPNYRPIIEHDGLLWQRSRNQDTNKMKTREELLAEERDYKRRRMSYRGKKLKRNSLEVTRDIIEEYMEEIKQSGGIGSLSKALEGEETSASDNLHKHESSSGVSGSRRNPEISEENGAVRHDYRRRQSSYRGSEDLEDDIQHRRRESSLDHKLQDLNRNGKRVSRDRDDYFGSRDVRSGSHSKGQYINETGDSVEGYSRNSHRSGIKSHEVNYHKRERYGHEHYSHRRERNERDRDSHERGRDRDTKGYRDRGRSKGESDDRKIDEEGHGNKDRRRSKTNRNDISRLEAYSEFEDRYDPAESHNIYEDDA